MSGREGGRKGEIEIERESALRKGDREPERLQRLCLLTLHRTKC